MKIIIILLFCLIGANVKKYKISQVYHDSASVPIELIINELEIKNIFSYSVKKNKINLPVDSKNIKKIILEDNNKCTIFLNNKAKLFNVFTGRVISSGSKHFIIEYEINEDLVIIVTFDNIQSINYFKVGTIISNVEIGSVEGYFKIIIKSRDNKDKKLNLSDIFLMPKISDLKIVKAN